MQTGQVRTTVYLDEELYIAAKKKAIEDRTTLTELIKKGLENQVVVKKKPDEKPVKDILELRGIFKTKKRIPFRKVREGFGEYLARRHLCSNT